MHPIVKNKEDSLKKNFFMVMTGFPSLFCPDEKKRVEGVRVPQPVDG